MIIRLKKYYAVIAILLIILAATIPLGIHNSMTAMSTSTNNGKELLIIMYHHTTENNNRVGKYTIHVDELEADFKYLSENGYTAISVEQLINHVKHGSEIPEKPVILTFDDGQESFYSYVYPLLQKYNMCALTAVIGKYADVYSETEDHNLNYSHMTWEEIKELSESGIVEIGNHSYDMHSYDKGRNGCSRNKGEDKETYKSIFREDTMKNQERIKAATGKAPVVYAYPFGYRCNEAVEVLKENGFEAALTCAEKLNYIEYDPDWLFTLSRFNRSGKMTSAEFFASVYKS